MKNIKTYYSWNYGLNHNNKQSIVNVDTHEMIIHLFNMQFGKLCVEIPNDCEAYFSNQTKIFVLNYKTKIVTIDYVTRSWTYMMKD